MSVHIHSAYLYTPSWFDQPLEGDSFKPLPEGAITRGGKCLVFTFGNRFTVEAELCPCFLDGFYTAGGDERNLRKLAMEGIATAFTDASEQLNFLYENFLKQREFQKFLFFEATDRDHRKIRLSDCSIEGGRRSLFERLLQFKGLDEGLLREEHRRFKEVSDYVFARRGNNGGYYIAGSSVKGVVERTVRILSWADELREIDSKH